MSLEHWQPRQTPETAPQPPNANASSRLALSGIRLVVGNLKQQVLENTSQNLESDLERMVVDGNESARIVSNTANKQLLPLHRSSGLISKSGAERIDATATKPYGHVDDMGNPQPSLRPISKSHVRKKRRGDNILHKNMRFAVVNDLAHLREDIPVEAASAVPDRRPEIGSKETRQKIDELLRMKGLLDDQPPQQLPQPVAIGTRAHESIVKSGRFTPRETKEIRRSAASASENQRKITKGVEKIRKQAEGRTIGQRVREIRYKHIQKRLRKTNERIIKTKQRNEILRNQQSQP